MHRKFDYLNLSDRLYVHSRLWRNHERSFQSRSNLQLVTYLGSFLVEWWFLVPDRTPKQFWYQQFVIQLPMELVNFCRDSAEVLTQGDNPANISKWFAANECYARHLSHNLITLSWNKFRRQTICGLSYYCWSHWLSKHRLWRFCCEPLWTTQLMRSKNLLLFNRLAIMAIVW